MSFILELNEEDSRLLEEYAKMNNMTPDEYATRAVVKRIRREQKSEHEQEKSLP